VAVDFQIVGRFPPLHGMISAAVSWLTSNEDNPLLALPQKSATGAFLCPKYFEFLATLFELAGLIDQVNDITGYTLSDKSLVDRVLRGDTGAFAEIIKNTEGLTAQIVFKMIDNTEDRKDIAQDIYLKVFNKLSGFRFESKLSTWIAQISYNTCLSYLEKKKMILVSSPSEETTDDGQGFENRGPGDIPDSETEIAVSKKELSFILKKEIENLPPVYKTLVTLYHRERIKL
jgi:RNA polymerase sigma factor (sigma-70 family)